MQTTTKILNSLICKQDQNNSKLISNEDLYHYMTIALQNHNIITDTKGIRIALRFTKNKKIALQITKRKHPRIICWLVNLFIKPIYYFHKYKISKYTTEKGYDHRKQRSKDPEYKRLVENSLKWFRLIQKYEYF